MTTKLTLLALLWAFIPVTAETIGDEFKINLDKNSPSYHAFTPAPEPENAYDVVCYSKEHPEQEKPIIKKNKPNQNVLGVEIIGKGKWSCSVRGHTK